MLTIFRRHSRTCPHRTKGREWRKCQCPIHLEGYVGNKYVRESLGIRSWDVAQAKVREREANALFPEEEKAAPIEIQTAIDKFLKDGRGRHLADATISKYEFLLNQQLVPFAEDKGFQLLAELDVESMREFRATWKDNALSGYKKGERLRSFFHFCVGAKYIGENPVSRMRPPKVPPTKIKTFSGEDIEKILWACDLYDRRGIYGEANQKRVKAFVLVLRYTGLRIRDVVTLERKKIDKHGKLYFYTAKTGTPVFLPLPPAVIDSLKNLPNLGSFYFWTGNGLPKSAVADWQRSLRKLFALAGVKGNPHMFRHTFATELLTKGVSLETVGAILGNTPAIVQKHYSHFVKSWQMKLEEDVRKVWV